MSESHHRGKCQSDRPVFVFLLGLFLALPLASPTRTQACPFCANLGKTLSENIAESAFVAYGILSDAKHFPDAPVGQPDGNTTMRIEVILKDHPVREGKTKVELARFIAGADKEPIPYLVFAEVVEKRIDPYRGMPVDTKELVDYLDGAVKLEKAPAPQRLAFFFRHLDSKNPDIASDSYKEFAAAPYKEVVAAAKSYDPNKILGWIKDKNSPSYRMGLYGCLLGVSGSASPRRAEFARDLRAVIESPQDRPLAGVDGLLGGYCELEPKTGQDLVLDLITNPKNDFNLRYAALRTVRFLLSEGLPIKRDHLFARLSESIAITDMTDLVIDEFRRHQEWSHTEKILVLFGKPDYDLQVVRRAVVRYALKCPDSLAREFIVALRKKDPQLVTDVEEILRFEDRQSQTAPPSANGGK